MFLIREVMYCKPGQVKPMVQKSQALARIAKSQGLFSMRVLTDACAERFWTVVMEVETESLDKFEAESRKAMENKELQEVMKGYHDHIDYGRREIYKIEGQ
jgi:hypothetical protein